MANLSFLNIKEKSNKKVIKLYNEAFPKEERISTLILKLLARKNKAKFYGIYDNEKFVGLIYNIYYKDIVFIFYLAINKEFYIKNGFKDANYTIKEKGVLYEMLYYNESDKRVSLQEFEEMMKKYFGKILYQYFYCK